jgi:hypothetical protein
MNMKAKKNLTIEDLKQAVEKHCDIYSAVYETPADDDISMVNFDTENMEQFGIEDYSYNHLPGLENLDGYEILGEGESAFPVLWVAAGGDWELPLVFVLFIGEDEEIHAYVPDDGNAYNHEKKAAYGNNEGDPEYGDEEDTRYVFDVAKMKADIENSITVK